MKQDTTMMGRKGSRSATFGEGFGAAADAMAGVAEVYGGGDMARTASGDGAAAVRLL